MVKVVHYGDIREVDGHKIEPVNCVIGGSPCTDVSVAGSRQGLSGKQSSLYFEQIRVIKEMREHDEKNGRTGRNIRPRYMVWENVPGAFSTNHGRDFATVLEEAIKIVEPEIPAIEVPEKGWPNWGRYMDMGRRWSVAWRVLDAQYWGVPQRRRRIALVVDFGGDTAGEILFEPESVSGNSGESEETWKRIAGIVEDSNRKTSESLIAFRYNAGEIQDIALGQDLSPIITVTHPPAVYDMSHSNDVIRECGETVPTLAARMGTGGNQVPLVYNKTYCIQGSMIGRQEKNGPMGSGINEDVSFTLNTVDRHCIVEPICIGNGQANQGYGDKAGALNCMHDQQAILDSHKSIRRLTPLECERLQGFPDNWTDIGEWRDSKGKLHKESSDTARYKALGNSIAIPPWSWVLTSLCEYLNKPATMGSLFDGIGGFPLIWERINGQGSCLWSSEIEEFPIAVTKYHFDE